jgi:hypothetical protein
MRLHFAPGKDNRKLAQLEKLTGKRLYTFSILSGHNCPFAQDCQSFAMDTPAGRRIKDGKKTKFRCFSASQEVLFPGVYNSRKENTEIVSRAGESVKTAAELFALNIPKKAELIRIHVGGDFKTLAYFDMWLRVAAMLPHISFYAYTKSLPIWVKRINSIPANLQLTASLGGKRDDLINTYGLRSARVVENEAEAEVLGLPIDHDDSIAALPENRDTDFALLLHGPQRGRRASYGYGKMAKGGKV